MNDNVAMLFSAIVTISTAVVAWLTAVLVSETRRMRQVQTEPKIDVTYRVRDESIAHLDIVIRNIGLGPAYNIRFRAEAVSASEGTQELLQELVGINFIASGLHYLSPGQQVSSFLTSVSENFRSKITSSFKVTATYASAEHQQYKDEYLINLAELRGLRRVGEPPLHRIANSLEALQEDVHELVPGAHTGRGRARVEH
jgi:hypothetical protein